jgi:hypothetical protein
MRHRYVNVTRLSTNIKTETTMRLATDKEKGIVHLYRQLLRLCSVDCRWMKYEYGTFPE